MLLALSLAGWSLVVAAVSVGIALAGFLVSARSIRTERDDRREGMGDAWAREWAAQRPVVYPRLPAVNPSGGQVYLKLKNGGRGPALNVEGDLTLREDEGEHRWGGLSVGAIAAGDEEVGPLAGPRLSPPWSRISGELR